MLRDALVALPGFPGMTVSKVEGCSAPSRHVPARIRIKDELTDYTPKVRIEISRPTKWPRHFSARHGGRPRTGHYGDGLVWITDVEKVAFVFKTMPGPA